MRTEKYIFAIIILLALTATVSACPECRAKVEVGLYNQDFSANLFIILLPILILTATGTGIYYAVDVIDKIKEVIGNG